MSHQQNHQLIAALNNCVAECNHCTTACLDEQDVKMLAKCIKLDIYPCCRPYSPRIGSCQTPVKGMCRSVQCLC